MACNVSPEYEELTRVFHTSDLEHRLEQAGEFNYAFGGLYRLSKDAWKVYIQRDVNEPIRTIRCTGVKVDKVSLETRMSEYFHRARGENVGVSPELTIASSRIKIQRGRENLPDT